MAPSSVREYRDHFEAQSVPTVNRHQFVTDPHVVNFVARLAPRLTVLPVTLAIPHHRRFVPGGIRGAFVGVDAVTAAYMWRSAGMATGDWAATSLHTARLSRSLCAAVAARDHVAAIEAAWEVIRWGGGNRSAGAYPFLANMGADVIPYLLRAQAAFDLAAADEAAIAPPVVRMNSMLTKLHAFLATDGLPIYDSRVATATATLVEAWRQERLAPATLAVTPIPATLHFPTVPGRTPSRVTVRRKFPTATEPAHLGTYNAAACAVWSSAMIRLGWLLQELLTAQPAAFPGAGSLAHRMRALEAALFMIGYDVSCL